MHVLFVAPHFPAYQRKFVRALKSVGARVTGIGEADPAHLPGELKADLYGYERVGNVCDEQALLDAVRRVQRREWVDRLEATIEAHILPTARVREAATIPGLTVKAAILCRDKPLMKEFLREHGIPCARSTGASSIEELQQFVREVGYPIIIKPRAGAGAAGTHRVTSDAELAEVVPELGLSHGGGKGGGSVALEEFIEGHEGFYDTLCVGGQVLHEFVSHYYPNVLEAMRTRWISPQIVVTNRIDAPGYDEVKRLGRDVITAMGLGTVATHMEWFFGPKGLKFSEIGARPPGVGQWDLYCAANDIDLYREWAHALVHGRGSQTPSRRFSAGIIALRPSADGHIHGYSGADEIQARFGQWIIDAHLPPAGTRTQPVEAGYMANAWVRLRHPDYDVLREMLDTVGRTLKVHAG
ncbi:MAG: ATP-grasp domain-containing protein [Myxococcales bacterium]|nr:ATP-grasp domain-containing protein [Myxococcales bacterium]